MSHSTEKDRLIAEINTLRRERRALILAHNYVAAEIQEIADFCGDSLELSIKASRCDAPVLVVCGVRFMAETAKLLSPASTVVLVRPDAGCPMADMVNADTLKKFKTEHPDTLTVAYVNTTAEVKALVDICCTSGNAEKIVSSLPPDKEILFLPDRNLGGNLVKKLGRPMQLWEGCCPVHDAVTKEMILRARELYPNALVMIHPECRKEVVEAADAALSTGAMLKYAAESPATEFVVATESGILHRLRKENPGKKFMPLKPEILCRDMKKMTLSDVAEALRTMKYQVELSPKIQKEAVRSIRAMLEVK